MIHNDYYHSSDNPPPIINADSTSEHINSLVSICANTSILMQCVNNAMYDVVICI